MKKLISPQLPLSSQFKIRYDFIAIVNRWKHSRGLYAEKIDTTLLLQESGVRCHYVNDTLAGFEVIDQEQYLVFYLKYYA